VKENLEIENNLGVSGRRELFMTTIDCDYFLEMEGLDTHFGTNLIC